MPISKDLRPLFAQLRSKGWLIEMGHKSHFKLRAPNGGVVTCGGTLSDVRAIKNVKAWVKRVERGQQLGRRA